MLTDALRALVNNPFKEKLYETQKKKKKYFSLICHQNWENLDMGGIVNQMQSSTPAWWKLTNLGEGVSLHKISIEVGISSITLLWKIILASL